MLPSETEHLEFKEAKTQIDGATLLEYCVALANEGGGKLVLGVSNRPPRVVVGTQALPDLLSKQKWILDTLGFRVDLEGVDHPEGRVVVAHIPSRPCGTAYHRDGRYLMRSGESVVAMSEDRLRQIFDEGRPDWIEGAAGPAWTMAEVIERLDVQGFFELLRLPLPPNQAGILERLVSERMVDREGSGFVVRRIAALLLARRLEEFPDLSRKAPRVVVYSGASKLATRLDRTGLRGFAVGFRALVTFVMSQLPQNEVVEQALRRESKLVPEEVIRELVANALVHQDLSISGTSVMIEIYGDRVEISNPGEPIVPADRFIDGYRSRNERLAALMRRFGICEEKGSGVDRVVHTAEAFQLPAPDFRVVPARTVAVVFGPRPFDQMGRDDRTRACYQHCCLRHVMSQSMTNQSLRARFKLPEGKSTIVSQILSATTEAGLIKPDTKVGASRKYARYLPFWA